MLQRHCRITSSLRSTRMVQVQGKIKESLGLNVFTVRHANSPKKKQSDFICRMVTLPKAFRLLLDLQQANVAHTSVRDTYTYRYKF